MAGVYPLCWQWILPFTGKIVDARRRSSARPLSVDRTFPTVSGRTPFAEILPRSANPPDYMRKCPLPRKDRQVARRSVHFPSAPLFHQGHPGGRSAIAPTGSACEPRSENLVLCEKLGIQSVERSGCCAWTSPSSHCLLLQLPTGRTPHFYIQVMP